MMRRLILLSLAVSAAFGQGTPSKQQPPQTKPSSLNILGAELRIGMKKAEVLSKLGGLSGYDVRPEVDMSGELYLLRIRKGNSDFAWISFKDGAVSQIFRTDHDYFSPEAIKAFKDLWDALHDINDNENETVAAVTTRVKTFTIHDPPTTHFDMWISFTNGKTVHIGWYSEGGESAASIEQQLSKPSL